ncbi:hypothetical protein ACFSKJ_15285 [Tabrizicola soli]
MYRREDNGKGLLIGIYPQDVVFPLFPATGAFVLYVQCTFSAAGSLSLVLRVQHSNGQEAMIDGSLDVLSPQTTSWLPVPLPPMTFEADTNLVASYRDEAGKWIEFFSIPIRKGPIPGTP